jgi:hypothetical protein
LTATCWGHLKWIKIGQSADLSWGAILKSLQNIRAPLHSLGFASLVGNTSGNGSDKHWGAEFSRNKLAMENSGRWLHPRKDTPKSEY